MEFEITRVDCICSSKTQINEHSLIRMFLNFAVLAIQNAPSEDSDQTARCSDSYRRTKNTCTVIRMCESNPTGPFLLAYTPKSDGRMKVTSKLIVEHDFASETWTTFYLNEEGIVYKRAETQSDQNLRWAHISEDSFCDVMVREHSFGHVRLAKIQIYMRPVKILIRLRVCAV